MLVGHFEKNSLVVTRTCFVGGAWAFFPPLTFTVSHEDMIDHRSYTHNLSSCANKA